MSLLVFQSYSHSCVLCGIIVFVGHNSLKIAMLHLGLCVFVAWCQVQLNEAERSLVRSAGCLDVPRVECCSVELCLLCFERLFVLLFLEIR